MKKIQSKCFALEVLEPRLCLSASVGWDGPGQGSASLSYYIGSVPDDLDEPTVEATLEAALEVWSDVADIRFEETTRSGRSDSIDFRFTNIDGPGRTLARAYFPDDLNRNPVAGDVQFDAAENWEVGNSRGSAAFDLMLVAVHEIGHALGLDHSSAIDSVMRAAVSAYDSFTGLSSHDVNAILSLYTPAQTPPPAGNEPAATDPAPALPQPGPVVPPSEPATPADTTPDPPPEDGIDDPPEPNEPEETDPDTEDDPQDFFPNRFERRGGWRRFPRTRGNFGPFFWQRFGGFPMTTVNRINTTIVGRSNYHDSGEQPPASQQPEKADDGQAATDQQPASRSEPDTQPSASRTASRHRRPLVRVFPSFTRASQTSFSPVQSTARTPFPRWYRR